MADLVTASTVPVAEEVGRMYDRMTLLAADFLEVEAQQGYNAHLGYWDTPESGLTYDEATDRLTDIMTERLRIGSGARVLDVGCGVGAPAVRIARLKGAEVTGISVSREQVDRAEALARATALQGRVTFRRADAMRLPFADDSFDAVLAIESMPHMPDREQVLRETARVLRPGGRVVLTDFYRRTAPSPTVHPLRKTMGSTTVPLDDYPAILRASGLEFVEMLDITEETVPRSFALLAERAERMGLDPESTEAQCYFNPQSVIDVHLLGYLLVVARRPQGD
ncbi:methyltransferase domain-containing protein [Streptomyces sp. FH025]|uniref:methyltransferase domain-containing protein n=1 Tax=Streptomyces sp. FH025 TaxID=2815937 RepID=UPI001A9DB1E9|nr:methyltransferase domain-containing protein [Streptomyces sp. FH025]MBO1413383.1 methyltransferase domain-containing protein [Streptomyces sp. FH025]